MCPEAAQGFSALGPDVRKTNSPAQSQAEPGSLGVPEILLKKALGVLALAPLFLYQSRARSCCHLKSSISPALINSSDQEKLKQQMWSTREKSSVQWKPPECLRSAYLEQPGPQHSR